MLENVNKKVVGALVSAAAVGFGAGQLAKLPQPHVSVHAVDLRVVKETLPDGGMVEVIHRQAWGHVQEKSGPKDLGPGKCADVAGDPAKAAAQVIADAETECVW